MGVGEEEGERVTEWERGLPSADDLTPLSQVLIPPGLASAFSISPEPYKTFLDVARASESTFSGLRSGSGGAVIQLDDDLIGEDDEVEDAVDAMEEEGDRDCKIRRIESAESETAEGEKRPRLVWTPQLHKRFVEVVAHLGIKSAVPKTIMQLMNVEGLTRENVASHLQKYRLYLKRMQGGPGGGSSEGSRARPDPPQTNANRIGNGNGNSSTDGGSSDGYHPHTQQPHQVAFHPHPGAGMMMQMPMYRHMGGNGGSESGGGGGNSSNHHHHHFHHHQHQFNGYDNGGGAGAGGSGAQSGFNEGFGYHGSSYRHHATPSDA